MMCADTLQMVESNTSASLIQLTRARDKSVRKRLTAGSGGGSEGTELMFSWFLLTRSISGVNTTGVPLAELSL